MLTKKEEDIKVSYSDSNQDKRVVMPTLVPIVKVEENDLDLKSQAVKK